MTNQKCFKLLILLLFYFFTIGGEGGIRTHGGFAPTPDFESGTFDHSATSPVCAIGGINCGYDDVAPYLGQARYFSRNSDLLDLVSKARFTGVRVDQSGDASRFR